MKQWKSIFIPLCLVGGLALLAGCSSGPSADEMAELDALKHEVASLQKEVATKQSEKASLEQQITTKKQELSQAVQDENETKANLAKLR